MSAFKYEDERMAALSDRWGLLSTYVEKDDPAATPDVVKELLTETFPVLLDSWDADESCMIPSKDLTKFMLSMGSCLGALSHWLDPDCKYIGPSEMEPYFFLIIMFFHNFVEDDWAFDKDEKLILRSLGVVFTFDPTTFDLPDKFKKIF